MVVSTQKKVAYRKGIWAESFASLYFMAKGFRTLKTRYKVKEGEIDLVMCKGHVVTFVEVKARNSSEQALEAVTYKARKRIESAALRFIEQYPDYADYDLRFDIVGVVDRFCVEHLENAWRPD